MLKFFENIVDKVEGQVLGYIDKYLESDMKPALRTAVEELVVNFRSSVVDKVPQQVGRQLQDHDSDRVTGMIAEALAGKVERMLERLLEYFRPQVDRATDTLTDKITEETMEKVRAYLKITNEAEKAAEAGARGFKLPGVGEVDFSQSVGAFLNVNERMPTLEKDLRDNFQPIAQMLNSHLWNKFLEVLNAVLNEAFPWLELPVPRDLPDPQVQDRGWFSDKVDDVQDALKRKVSKHIPELYEALKDPVGEIIASMVKWLEDQSVKTSVEQVHKVVKDLDLVKMQQ